MVPENGFAGGALFWCGENRSPWQARAGIVSGPLDQADPFPTVRFAGSAEVTMRRHVGKLVTEDLQKHRLLEFTYYRVQANQ